MNPLDPILLALSHHGHERRRAGDPLQPAIVPTSAYHLPGDPAGPYQYGRWSNPTWTLAEEALSILEQAEAILFPSGMAAITAATLPLLEAGDRVLLPDDGYGATRAFARTYLQPLRIRVETCPTPAMAARDLTGFKLVWVETPSNPGLEVCDLAALVARARAADALVVADNTTLTPLGQRPLDLGVDVVVSADTKAVNGHSDLLAGHVATRIPGLAERVRTWRTLSGAISSPFDAWALHRGLETLPLRFERMTANAQIVAERLVGHPALQALHYPGLPDHSARSLLGNQMLSPGFLIGLTLASKEEAEAFLAACPTIRPATSFGGLHTSAERRQRWGDAVADGFIRLSVGCEPLEPLWQSLATGLANVTPATR